MAKFIAPENATTMQKKRNKKPSSALFATKNFLFQKKGQKKSNIVAESVT